jgi:hypothetical protein
MVYIEREKNERDRHVHMFSSVVFTLHTHTSYLCIIVWKSTDNVLI